MTLNPPLGIFGGTFDPIHNGHIFPVLEAAEKSNIQKVALMPCYIPSHKADSIASSQDRMAMIEKVCDEYSLFYPDSRDIKRGTPTYTLDSLQSLKQAHPNTPLCFFIGTDSLQNIFDWHEWRSLFSLCHFVVCKRKGSAVFGLKDKPAQQEQLEALLNQRQTITPLDLHKKMAGHIYIADTQTVTISSTKIRQQISNHHYPESFLPTKVLDYIRQHKLYQPRHDF